MINKNPTFGDNKITRRRLLKNTAMAGVASLCGVGHAHRSAHAQDHRMRGVALAGADFGQLVPGQHGRDYFYPTLADFEFCRAQSFNTVRLPFRWERLQPDLNAPFDAEEWQRLSACLIIARKLGLKVLLDPHNYAHRRVRNDNYTVDHQIGSDAVPTESFAAFWGELAKRTQNDAHVVFGLMNEPSDLAADAWLSIANAAIDAIRATGSMHLILVPGTAYTGAHSWVDADNVVLTGVRDPASNFAIEVHQYLDTDSSGRSPDAVSETIGFERLQAFQAWARENKLKAVLGEFGAARNATSLKALEGMVREVEQNADVWIGWTAWAAGSHWPESEPFRLSLDTDGKIPPQTRLLSRIARAAR